ncbi:MAG: redox-sensing transcriptional repressor Rex [Clostridiales bacterium]|nr:MAG: redox-sensing transcriptional repressor Rex [Clostridiales bacterium]
MDYKSVSVQTISRLPRYLNYLKGLPKGSISNISATMIAEALGLNDVQVRKDLSLVSDGGRPKIGYAIEELITDIEHFLGYDDTHSAVLVGVGNLGTALLSYGGFAEYGLDIVAAFDVNESLVGCKVNGKQIFPLTKLIDLCKRMQIKIGIITVPNYEAQKVCDMLVESGVQAIWNFAPAHLNAPPEVLIQSENMACSLALLSKHLSEKLKSPHQV